MKTSLKEIQKHNEFSSLISTNFKRKYSTSSL